MFYLIVKTYKIILDTCEIGGKYIMRIMKNLKDHYSYNTFHILKNCIGSPLSVTQIKLKIVPSHIDKSSMEAGKLNK